MDFYTFLSACDDLTRGATTAGCTISIADPTGQPPIRCRITSPIHGHITFYLHPDIITPAALATLQTALHTLGCYSPLTLANH